MTEQYTRKEKTKLKNKTGKSWRYFRRVYAVIAIIVVGAFTYMGYNLYTNFKATMTWEKNTSSPIAEVEPYTLYLTESDHKEIGKYNSFLTQIYNQNTGDFKPEASEDLVNKFTNTYNKMSGHLQERESENYNKIIALWTIKKGYEDLFENPTTLKPTSTPAVIKKFVDDNGKNIKKFMEDTNDKSQKVFITNVYNSLENLSKDSVNISTMITIFDSIYYVNGNTVKVRKDVTSAQLTEWNKAKESLNYNWVIVDGFMSSVINKSAEILNNHDSKVNEYNLYNTNKENKAEYEQWLKSYKETKANLVTYKNFTGQYLDDIKKWANENNITLNVTYIDSFEDNGKILTQTPNANDYGMILKGTTISISVSKEIVVTTSSSSTSSSSTSSSSSTYSSSLETRTGTSSSSSSSSSNTRTSSGDN